MNVEDFMAKLAAQTAPMQKNENRTKGRVLEKISLNYEGNFGRYQVLPLNDVITDYPFVKLDNTREICIPRKNVAPDGTESVYNAWVKLLPKAEGYRMKDATGRVTSSLTAEEDQLLSEAYMLFDQLYNEIDAKTNINISRDLMRKRNYTIFHAYCCNKWNFDGSREPVRSKFCGLFVSTAKGFTNAVEDDLKGQSIMGEDISYIQNLYSRQLKDRDGFMMFSISRNKSVGMGYNVSVNHKGNAKNMLQEYVITEEEADLMKDPIATLLSWQANREDASVPAEQRRLFNAPLIKEAMAYMTQQLAAVRAAKAAGTSIEAAIKTTNETAFGNTPAATAKTTNDPMLQNQQAQQVNDFANAQAKNDAPFQTPPAAHIDPITSAPVNNNPGQGFGGFSGGFGGGQQAPFAQPGFAQFGKGEGDLPF